MVSRQAVEEKSKIIEAIVENIPIAIFLKDARDEFRITLWNKAAEDIFEVPRSTVLGKVTHDLWPKEHADAYLAADQAVAEQGRSIDIPDE
ncbi:PAS domain-containing protein, partial [Klebsiella pneumoniae]